MALIDAVNKAQAGGREGRLPEEGRGVEHDGRGRARRPGEPAAQQQQ